MAYQKTLAKRLLNVTLAGILAICSISLGVPAAAAPHQIIDQRDHDKYQTFEGQVIWVGDQQFDLRVNDDVFHVYSSKPLPYKMGQGYNVKVYGEPVGRNTILDANTMVISSGDNEINDKNTRHGYENIFGVVSRIASDLELEIRAGSRIYNISLARKKPEQLKRGDEVSVYGPLYGSNNIRSASIKIIKGNPDNNSRKYYEEYVGIVTSVRSRAEFEIEIEKKTYDVYLSKPMPHRLSKNDVVSVYGQRYGRNDIRYADVFVLRNDRKTESRNEALQTFVGSVVEVRPSKSFDLRVGDIIYNVTTAVEVPRNLSRNDIVRVYGKRIGTSNIYDANVRILRDRIDRDHERYQTFIGVVTKVNSNKQFDIHVNGDIYNISVAGDESKKIHRDDVVQVYGQLHGNNDVRDADVKIIGHR